MNINDLRIYVLNFDKTRYKRCDIDELSDIEKYMIANNDKDQCWIYTAKEYTDNLNCFKPMEKYVWTYIVVLPMELYSDTSKQ